MVTTHDFCKFFVILITAYALVYSGATIWWKDTDGVVRSTDMGWYIKDRRFKEIKNIGPNMYKYV